MRPRAGFTRIETALVVLGGLIFSAAFCYPMVSQLGELGPGLGGWLMQPPDFSHLSRWPVNGDWDLFTELRWVPYHTLSNFHQLPFWNPYKCGGMGMLSNPESSILTPFLLPYLLFGSQAGLYLEIYLHIAIAFVGGYVLARVLGLNRIAAVVCGAIFPASSWLYLHLSVGHLNFLPAAYLPWIAAMFAVSIDRRTLFPAAIGGALTALTLTEGNYTFLYAVIVVGMLAVVLSIQRRSLRPLITGLVVGVFSLGFAALKLVPMQQQLTMYPKHPFGLEGIGLSEISIFLFSRSQDLYRFDGPWEFLFCEYGAYLSAVFVTMSLLGLLARPMRVLPWLAPALMFLLFARGYTSDRSAVLILRYLPLSQSAGLPGRYLIPFVFCVGVVAAYGADDLSSRFGRFGKGAAVILMTLGVADSWIVSAPNLRYLFHNPVNTVPASRDFRQFWVASPDNMTAINEANMGSVNCQGFGYNDIPQHPRGFNQTDYRGEYYLTGPGTVMQTSWTPNRLSFNVESASPAILVVNQNFYPGWRLARGDGKLVSHGGLVAVELPPGHQEVVLSFLPDHFVLAWITTLIAIAGAIALWFRERTRVQLGYGYPAARSFSSEAS